MERKVILPQMIDYYRKSNGLKMKELGEKINKSESTISLWISGKRSPMVEDLEKLSLIFGVTSSELMYGAISETKRILDSVFGKLQEPRQKKVLKCAQNQLKEQNSENNKVMEIADYQIEKKYPYYDDAVSAGTGQFIGTSQRDTITLPVDFDADYVVPVCGDSMEPEYYDGNYIFVESTVNVADGEIGVFEYYGDTYVKQLILEDDHAYLHSLNNNYKDMKVDADSDFRVLGKVVGRYAEK